MIIIPGICCAFIMSWAFTVISPFSPYRTIGPAVLPIFQIRRLRPGEIGVIDPETHS